MEVSKMPVDSTIPVLDLKPLSYNPFLDGTVVYDNTGGVLVPRSAGSMVDPVGNALLDARPSNASTQSLIDSARSVSRGTVQANPAALRGYRTSGSFFDTRSFERAVDNLSDAELNNFIDDLISQPGRAASENAATATRKGLNGALKAGSEIAGAVGLAIDAYNIADAVLDPTNNPADEIGDFVGSTIGGALGSKLGPFGALGGALAGGWIGRQIGNLLQGGGSAFDDSFGPAPFEGGQCPTRYKAVQGPYTYLDNNGVLQNGPAGSTSFGNGPLRYVTDRGGQRVRLASGTGSSFLRTLDVSRKGPNARIVDNGWIITREDGLPDDCGDPQGEPTKTPTRPTYAPLDFDSPNFFRPNLPDTPLPDGLPEVPDDAPTSPTSPDSPTGNPDDTGSPNLDDPPSPDDLPEPRPQPDEPGPDPNPEPDDSTCCSETIQKLNEIIDLLSWEYSGEVDISACGDDPEIVEWRGSGLDGVTQALLVLQEQLQLVHENTKCGPEPAPLPMLWEVKSGQVPQLAISWVRTAGGTSKWSMHVPHPRSDINPDVPLSFPDYVKGPLMATLKLNDNSKVIVNARDKTEADKVIGYLTSQIIDGSYLTDSKLTYTEGAASRVIAEVKAVHISAYGSKKGDPPLWAKSLD
ncbi:hypothetical protein SPB21_27700 [Leptothoe sp. ISB3NOV94-8A]